MDMPVSDKYSVAVAWAIHKGWDNDDDTNVFFESKDNRPFFQKFEIKELDKSFAVSLAKQLPWLLSAVYVILLSTS